MKKEIKKFSDFVNEATLRGNIGLPGEDPEMPGDSLLNALLISNREEAENYLREHSRDLGDFQSNISRSKQLQAGHEEELSKLAEEAMRNIYGTFLDDIILDLKIVTRPVQEMRDKMEECPECENIQDLEDQEIIDEINKRKIFRTIQQGKGLNVKEIINSPFVLARLKEILGNEKGEQYRILLNKISAAAHLFDLTLTPEQKRSMFRQAPPGACDIQIKKKDEEEEAEEIEFDPEEILRKIQQDGDLNDEALESLDDLETKVIARAMDFGLLVHESVKGVYKLITQSLLLDVGERLGLEAAELVKMNTETLFDEIEEQAVGKKLQEILGLIINTNKRVMEITDNILSSDDQDAALQESAAFMEQLHWLVYGKIAQITPAKKCLEFFNSILSQTIDPVTKRLKPSSEIGKNMDRSLIDPIINQSLDDMEAEKQYQAYKSKMGKDQGDSSGIDGFDSFSLN